MRWIVLVLVIALSMVGTGYGLYKIQTWLELPDWTGIITLAATIWVAQWIAKEVDGRLFK